MRDRINRINGLIKEQVANILLREGFFNKDVLVTVQKADTTKDLRYAKIGVSVMPFEKSKEILRILKKQTLNIQKELGKFVKIKFLPKIEFQIDETEEKIDKIEKILKKIKM